MTAIVRSELLALRTLRSSWAVPAVLLSLIAVVVAASMSDAGSEGFRTPAELREALVATAGIMSAVVMALFAATRTAGEYRHGTVTHRLLATPRRNRRLAVTLLVYGSLGLVMGALGAALAIGIAQPIVASKDLTLGLGTEHVAGILLSVVLFSLIGVALGVITRSQPVAVGVVFGLFVAEKLLALLISDATEYMPYALLYVLNGIPGSTMSWTTAAVLLSATTALAIAAAATLLARRDVT
jgi:ABC-2 type transport system permease protein